MDYFLILLQLLIGYHLIFPLLIYVYYKLKAKNKQSKVGSANHAPADFGVIVTAYQYTESLPAVVGALLKQDYADYLIYVVADNCDTSNLNFTDARVILLQPPTVIASNTGSHFYAIDHFKRPHNYIVIMDSDNIAEPGLLSALNRYVVAGHTAIQGLRKAKNKDTQIAKLDAARDLYYHFFDGHVLFSIGASATLSGSGMTFQTELYKACLAHLNIQGAGFDKVLQAEIVKRDVRIAFAEDAIVYDEKTSKSDQLVKQRARWINTWFRYFKFGFTLLGKGITNASFNQTIFGLVLLRPPLFIFLVLSGICMMLNLFFNLTGFFLWIIGFGCFFLSFYIALRESKADKSIYKALLHAPVFIFYQILALMHIRRANKLSVATQHYHNNDSNLPE